MVMVVEEPAVKAGLAQGGLNRVEVHACNFTRARWRERQGGSWAAAEDKSRNGDDNFAADVARFDGADCGSGFAEWKAALNDRRDFSGLDEIGQKGEVGGVDIGEEPGHFLF